MSYALAFTADARYDLGELDFNLQELVLDELDRVAASQTLTTGNTFVRDIVHELPGIRHYLFLHLAVDLPRSTLVILGIHHHGRQID